MSYKGSEGSRRALLCFPELQHGATTWNQRTAKRYSAQELYLHLTIISASAPKVLSPQRGKALNPKLYK